LLIDELGDFLLPQYQFHDFFELVLHLRSGRVDVDEQELVFEVGPGEVEEEGTEGEVDDGFVVLIEVVDELTVVVDLPAALVVLGLIALVSLQDFVADCLGFGHEQPKVLVAMGRTVLGQEFVILEGQNLPVRLTEGLLKRQQRDILFLEHLLLLLEQILVLIFILVLLNFVVFVLSVLVTVVLGVVGVEVGERGGIGSRIEGLGGLGWSKLEFCECGLNEGLDTSRFQL